MPRSLSSRTVRPQATPHALLPHNMNAGMPSPAATTHVTGGTSPPLLFSLVMSSRRGAPPCARKERRMPQP